VVVPEPSADAFETLVRDALDTLPDWLAPYLARISVQIDDHPPPGEDDVYAFFDGPALGDDPVGQLPPVITLFRVPLVEDFGDDLDELRHEVQITVAHELAHLFGFDEKRIDELGYG
jgi:predicted Zn-dependent protease with MMP-like domain